MNFTVQGETRTTLTLDRIVRRHGSRRGDEAILRYENGTEVSLRPGDVFTVVGQFQATKS